MAFCTKCGGQLSAGQMFCPACGAPATNNMQPQQQQPTWQDYQNNTWQQPQQQNVQQSWQQPQQNSQPTWQDYQNNTWQQPQQNTQQSWQQPQQQNMQQSWQQPQQQNMQQSWQQPQQQNTPVYPVFTGPTGGNASNNASNDVPTFSPPADDIPTFNPPADDIPTFAPPADDIPTFAPPADDIPTFTPPADDIPTFTPPTRNLGGNVCHFHRSSPAVSRCACCNKFICQDCEEAYGVSSGKYAGHPLCYDCTVEMVADNVRELTKNKRKIKFQFILSLIGMGLGFIYGMSMIATGGGFASLFAAFIFACIGGVFLSAVKAFFSLAGEAIGIAFRGQFGIITILSLMWQMLVLVIKCVVVTISNTYYYIKYLKETSGFIESDSRALQEMKDYMEYTQIASQNKGVDIQTLMNQNSQLYNNSYAQSVAANGEAAADARLRQCVTTIAENGEIIRNFAA